MTYPEIQITTFCGFCKGSCNSMELYSHNRNVVLRGEGVIGVLKVLAPIKFLLLIHLQYKLFY